jgi:hypothetical protein
MKMDLRLPLLAACVLTVFTFSNALANDPGPHRGGLRYEPYHESRRDFNNWLERRYSAEGRHASPIADDPGSGGNGGGQAPIDGGLSLLLAAGLGLGIKKAMKKNHALNDTSAQ